MITNDNYEFYFIEYWEGNLPDAEKNAVLKFINENPQLQPDFDAFRDAVIPVDSNIIYADKDSLKKKTINRRLIPFYWSAAACLITALLIFKFYINNEPVNVTKKFVVNSMPTQRKPYVQPPSVEVDHLAVEEKSPIKNTSPAHKRKRPVIETGNLKVADSKLTQKSPDNNSLSTRVTELADQTQQPKEIIVIEIEPVAKAEIAQVTPDIEQENRRSLTVFEFIVAKIDKKVKPKVTLDIDKNNNTTAVAFLFESEHFKFYKRTTKKETL